MKKFLLIALAISTVAVVAAPSRRPEKPAPRPVVKPLPPPPPRPVVKPLPPPPPPRPVVRPLPPPPPPRPVVKPLPPPPPKPHHKPAPKKGFWGWLF
ncbi:MAG: hypothetical protein IJW33_05965 [Lentisphaeria bacterium]|nr:hypothetical protein [Lentisphaeria bacterium]